MHTSVFFKIFPPPKLILMEYSGLDISDDAIRCLRYVKNSKTMHVAQFGEAALPAGIVSGGDIKDEKAFLGELTKFNGKKNLRYVKVSIPEEKSYLFQTEVPVDSLHAISQNIESKLEENVPLPAPEVVFYFDLLPLSVTKGVLKASVSVVPRVYVESMISMVDRAGMRAVAFEVVPKAVARATISSLDTGTMMIINSMNEKTGIYVVSAGVVCFTSTVPSGEKDGDLGANLGKEINRVYEYWTSHSTSETDIKQIILVGGKSLSIEKTVKKILSASRIEVVVGNVWRNAFSLDKYIPPISMEDSLDYAAASGLAIES